MYSNNKPLVTCIVTCYKKIDYLKEAVMSVINQDYQRIELLITDDGTEGFDAEYFERFVDENKLDNIENCVVYHHSKNVGTVKNINGMLRIAKGDYFIGLDGDDVFYEKSTISKIVDRFLVTGADFLSCSRMMCEEKTLNEIKQLPDNYELEKIAKLNSAYKQYKSFLVFQFYDIASGSAMYFTRKNLEMMGLFDETYRQWQDGPRITEYVKTIGPISTAFDIISIKYRVGGVSNAPKKNTQSANYLGADHARFIETKLIPNKVGTGLKKRRYFMFWYYWDQCDSNYKRLKLCAKYPEKFAFILFKKMMGKPIR